MIDIDERRSRALFQHYEANSLAQYFYGCSKEEISFEKRIFQSLININDSLLILTEEVKKIKLAE